MLEELDDELFVDAELGDEADEAVDSDDTVLLEVLLDELLVLADESELGDDAVLGDDGLDSLADRLVFRI